MTPDSCTAVSSFGNMLDSKYPKEADDQTTRARMQQNRKNWAAVIVVPTPKYTINEYIIGVSNSTGDSIIIFAMQQAPTVYI